MTREQQLRKYTMNIYLTLTLTLLISVLLIIVILRSQQVVIEEPRVATFSYTNIEEIEDIKPTPKTEYEVIFNEEEVNALCRMVYGESMNCGKLEMSGTVWCVLNRVDSWNKSIVDVIEQPGQFTGYQRTNPVLDEVRKLVIDVLTRWQIEKQGATSAEVMRTLPKEYLWWNGDATGYHNKFRNAYDGNYTIWNWSLPTPYDD